MRLIAAAIIAAGLSSQLAYGAPIGAASRLNIVGNANFDSSTVSITSPADVVINAGDFTAIAPCNACVTVVSPFTYVPFTATADLFTATDGAVTATVSLTGQLSPPQDTGITLSIVDSALLTLTGFDATPGEVAITVNQFGQLVGSFSSTSAPLPAPEPQGLAILGLGLIGLGAARRIGG